MRFLHEGSMAKSDYLYPDNHRIKDERTATDYALSRLKMLRDGTGEFRKVSKPYLTSEKNKQPLQSVIDNAQRRYDAVRGKMPRQSLN